MAKAKIIGTEIVIKGIENQTKAFVRKGINALKRILHRTGKKADYYCPKDTHDLVNSREMNIKVSKDKLTGKFTYGNERAYYALYVHEDKDKFHQPPTQSHFAEKALEVCEEANNKDLESLVEDMD